MGYLTRKFLQGLTIGCFCLIASSVAIPVFAAESVGTKSESTEIAKKKYSRRHHHRNYSRHKNRSYRHYYGPRYRHYSGPRYRYYGTPSPRYIYYDGYYYDRYNGRWYYYDNDRRHRGRSTIYFRFGW